MASSNTLLGTVAAIWRYPVKSMAGEQLDAVEIGSAGLLGDRGRALREVATGAIVCAKNPRKWATLLDCRATYSAPPNAARPVPPVVITLPDGTRISSDSPDAPRQLSRYFGREVALHGAPAEGQQIEMMLPNDPTEQVLEVPIPPEGFFDLAAVHLLTTASVQALAAAAPASRFDIRRFRPNLVIETPAGRVGFVENDWIGRTLWIGDDVELAIFRPCGRCIMTTVPQGDLPKDVGVLRAIAERNDANFGVYATVVTPGRVERGARVELR
ncbi:MAG: MOSC domain-containing protein [Pirellulales bacterium]|nr:MOSC domain-containing protein [Pirellulales bacterium]